MREDIIHGSSAMNPFSKWTISEVEDKFQIILHKQHPVLKEWLAVNDIASPDEDNKLNMLKNILLDHVHDWNESELKFKFIVHLLALVDFDQDKYQTFLEREIGVSMNGECLSGIVDFMVASGRRVPSQPFFFLHEYKRELDRSGDPLGQLVIAMIAAQKLNHNSYPLYGAYIIGRFWFFVILDGSDYAVSLAYDATKDEIKDIFGILMNVKAIIDKRVNKGSDD